MLYAEIKVKIYVDENQLTAEQQIQAEKADKNVLTQEHPIENGVVGLQEAIDKFNGVVGLSHFYYLNEGAKAVKIEVE